MSADVVRLGKLERRPCDLNLSNLVCHRKAKFLIGPSGQPRAWCAIHALEALKIVLQMYPAPGGQDPRARQTEKVPAHAPPQPSGRQPSARTPVVRGVLRALPPPQASVASPRVTGQE